jgi:dTMP kinase
LGALFLSFEGTEGSGKSTQIRRLGQRLEAAGHRVRQVREPGGTAVGEAIRALLLAHEEPGPAAVTEALLFAAARAQLVREVIEPALQEGCIVLSYRFVDSSLAYQGGGRGLGIDKVLAINREAIAGRWPDRTLLLDLPTAVGATRQRARAPGDRIESEPDAFHERVAEAFLQLAHRNPERITVIDGTGTPDEVQERIWEAVAPLLESP